LSELATSFRAEHELLLWAARGGESETDEAGLRASLARPLDWNVVCDTAREHGVAPLVYRRLRALPTLAPPAGLERLRQDAISQGLACVRLARSAVRVVAALREVGVRALPFKGAALGAAVYGDVALRPFRDLDLLVPVAEREHAANWLLSHGYRLATSERTTDERRGREYHQRYRHADQEVSIELHWELQPPPWPLPLSFDRLFARAAPLVVVDGELPALSWDDLLFVLAAHGGRHGYGYLLWVCDLERAVRSWERAATPDWPALLARATSMGCRRVLVVGLSVAGHLLGLELPTSVAAAAARDTVGADLALRLARGVFTGDSGLTQDQLLLTLRERRRERFRYLRYRTLRLATVYLRPSEKDRRFWSLPPGLRWAYPLVRLLRFVRERPWAAVRELATDLRSIVESAARRR
jgi:hypothetical protein